MNLFCTYENLLYVLQLKNAMKNIKNEPSGGEYCGVLKTDIKVMNLRIIIP